MGQMNILMPNYSLCSIMSQISYPNKPSVLGLMGGFSVMLTLQNTKSRHS